MHALVHVHCCLVPTATGSVTLTCLKKDGWPTGPSSSFDINVAAQVVDGPCSDDGDFTTTVTLNSKPTVGVDDDGAGAVCATGETGKSVTITYTATVAPASPLTWSVGKRSDDSTVAAEVACTGVGELQRLVTSLHLLAVDRRHAKRPSCP